MKIQIKIAIAIISTLVLLGGITVVREASDKIMAERALRASPKNHISYTTEPVTSTSPTINNDKTHRLSNPLPMVIIVVVIFFIVLFIKQSSIKSQKKKSIEENLDNLNDFTPTEKIMGTDRTTGIAIDTKRQKICLITYKSNYNDVVFDVIDYHKILASEIFEDGQSITQTSRGSQIGAALIGGLLLGGVGAIIGGLSGGTTSSVKVKSIDLRITVNNTEQPVHDINFLNVETIRGSTSYKSALDKIRHWQGMIDILMHRADEEDRKNENNTKLREIQISVANELEKLAQLKERGILSNAEFLEQKKKLLI